MWTDSEGIIDYLVFARNYVSRCEEKYGIDEVETILDACHALMNYGVDRYKHPPPVSLQEEKLRQQNREAYLQSQVNELWRTLPEEINKQTKQDKQHFPEDPQENILYFLEKNAPLLKPWQRELIRIVRKVAQYFYPQGQTKVMNEGWACFWHYTLMYALHDEGLVTDEFMLEILKNHTDVIAQPAYDSPYFSGINPYCLGYNMYQDIRRICENPSNEEKKGFPLLANTDWLTSLDYAMRNYKDESFVSQFLSPQLMRDLKLFMLTDNDQEPEMFINAIHNEKGYGHVREALSSQYNLGSLDPDIQVFSIDLEGDRALTLHYTQHNRVPLNQNTEEVLRHLYTLWKFPVVLKTLNLEGEIIATYQCPPEDKPDKTPQTPIPNPDK